MGSQRLGGYLQQWVVEGRIKTQAHRGSTHLCFMKRGVEKCLFLLSSWWVHSSQGNSILSQFWSLLPCEHCLGCWYQHHAHSFSVPMTLCSWRSLLPQVNNAEAQKDLETRTTAMVECLESTFSTLTITVKMGRVAMLSTIL